MVKESYYEISKSKFYAYGFEINSVIEFNEELEKLKKEHKKATHFCYAYIVDDDGHKEKYNDDKEPKSSAGQPIMNVLKRKLLNGYAVIVVRYFGGTKLGVGGLVRAYTRATTSLFDNK